MSTSFTCPAGQLADPLGAFCTDSSGNITGDTPTVGAPGTGPNTDGINLNTLGTFFGSLSTAGLAAFKAVNAPQPVLLSGRSTLPLSSTQVAGTTSSFAVILIFAVLAFFGYRLLRR